MKLFIQKLFVKLGIKSARTKNITKHIGFSFLYKIGSIAANLLLVPLTLTYLNTENYGIWLTLSSFITWFTFFDVGLGHGLRNKLAEAKAIGDNKLARAYISSAYYTIMTISFILLIIFLVLNYFINWTTIFNTNPLLKEDLSLLMSIVFVLFCIQLVVKLITSIHLGSQNHSILIKIQFLTHFSSLILLWILLKTTKSSLLIYGILFSVVPVLILFMYNWISFSDKYKNLKPKVSLWKKKYVNEVLGIGVKFFIIQISVLVLFSTDNIIISNLFSPEQVVPYNISLKYFSIIMILFSLIMAPFWSSITEAYTQNDFDWIRTSINNILKIWFTVIPLVLFLMVICSDWVYRIWVGETIVIPLFLSMSMSLFVLLNTFQMIFTSFINGVGKIRLQMIIGLITILINIPLSILLAKTFGLGTSGVILATCISVGIYSLYKPIQYSKIINKKAKGIWNK